MGRLGIMRDLDRRTVLQLLGLSALALQRSGCAAGDANLAISGVGRAPKGEPIRSTLSTFAAGLLDRMPDGNVVVSPVSIAVVLAMLANGASTTTRTQFETRPRVGRRCVEPRAQRPDPAARGPRRVKGTTLTLSNALWLQ